MGLLTGIKPDDVVWKMQELARNYQAEILALENTQEDFPKGVSGKMTFSAGVVSVKAVDGLSAGEGRGVIYESLACVDKQVDKELYRAKAGTQTQDATYVQEGRNCVSTEGNFELLRLTNK